MINNRDLVAVTFASWFIATVLSQHPDDTYSRIRRWADFTGGFLVPNWKFFAPNPGVNDYILMYRTGIPEAEEWSEWNRIYPAVKPTLRESFFHQTQGLIRGYSISFIHCRQSLGTSTMKNNL